MTSGPTFRWRLAAMASIACGAFWALAFAATHIPAEKVPHTGLSDRTLHFAGYFLLAGLLTASLAGFGVRPLRRGAAVILVMMAYGALDELTQAFVNRGVSFGDWLADLLGAITAVAAAGLVALALARRSAQ